jgi:hypothetical protein
LAEIKKLVGSDTLREAYPKINETTDNLDERIIDHEASLKAHKAENIEYTGTIPETNVKAALDDVDSRVDNLTSQTGDSNTEIVDARYDSVRDITYTVLKDRLDQDSIDLIRSKSFVETGLTATKNATTASQLDVVTGTAIMYQDTSIYSEYSPVAASFTTATASTIYYLDFNADGTWSWGTSHSTNVNYIPIAEVSTDTSGNIASVADKRPLSKVSNKVGVLSQLQTTDKSNLVNSINEGMAKVFYQTSALPSTPSNGWIRQLTADYTTPNGQSFKAGDIVVYISSVGEWRFLVDVLNELQTISIPHGLSIIETDQKSPLDIAMDGNSDINHMGKQGGFYSLFNRWDVTLAIDTSVYKFSTSSGKIDNSAGTVAKASRNTQKMYLSGKYVLVGFWAKAVSGTPTTRAFIVGQDSAGTDTDGTRLIEKVIDSSWKFYYKKFNLTASTDSQWITQLNVQTFGTANDVVNFDGMITYELTQTQYNEIDILTSDEVAEKYGYVDSVKHIQNPVVVSYGKNHVEPLYNLKSKFSTPLNVIEAYKAEVNKTATGWVHDYEVLKAVASQQYTYSVDVTISGFGGTGVGAYVFLNYLDKDGNSVGNHTSTKTTVTTTLSTTITTPANCAEIEFGLVVNTDSTGTFTFTNPQLELGSVATTFEKQNKTYLYGAYDSNENPISLGSNLDGSVADKLYNDNGWKVLKRWEKDKVMDGGLAWEFLYDDTGIKTVRAMSVFSGDENLQASNVAKYDGKILNKSTAMSIVRITEDTFYTATSATYFALSITDTDSGWTEAMTPTANMIKGYFNGWKYTGDGTTHSWVSIVDGSASPTQTEAYVSANIASGFTPYELSYQLSDSVVESVTLEGSLTLIEGLNQIEVSSGLINRELANPVLSSNGNYYINATNTGLEASKLENRTKKIIAVYKDVEKDSKWIIQTKADTSFSYGDERVYIPEADFDTTAEYRVSYTVLDRHLFTANALSAEGTYSTSEKARVDQLVDKVADNTTDISIHDMQIVNILARLSAGGL